MRFGAPPCSIFQRCPLEISNASSNSNNFAGWKTVTGFASPKRSTIRSAWMCRKTSRASNFYCATRAPRKYGFAGVAVGVWRKAQSFGGGGGPPAIFPISTPRKNAGETPAPQYMARHEFNCLKIANGLRTAGEAPRRQAARIVFLKCRPEWDLRRTRHSLERRN